MIGIIPLDVFCLDVAVFGSEEDRLAELRDQGCSDLTEHSASALASTHMDFTDEGSVRLSMGIQPVATRATWAHECVHVADFVMHYLKLPPGVKNTEIRAYLVGRLFAGLEEMDAAQGRRIAP
jgi:hypothetical protein